MDEPTTWYRVGQLEREPKGMWAVGNDLERLVQFGIPIWLVESAALHLMQTLDCNEGEAVSRLRFNVEMMNYRVPGLGYPKKCHG